MATFAAKQLNNEWKPMSIHTRGALIFAASAGMYVTATSCPTAHADTTDLSGLLNSVGIGNGGPITQLIEQIGQQICPLIAKPGGNMVSTATEASGHGGIASQVTGFVAEQAIQSQCPTVMTQLANGNFEPLIQMLNTANQATGTLNTLNGTSVQSVTVPQAGGLNLNP